MVNLHSFLEVRSKNIFKRCVECSSVTTATCPVCASDEICTLTSATCTQCPVYTCTKTTTSGAVDTNPNGSSHSKSSVPQIVGGIIGGIALIGIITFVIWRFVLKGKRRESVIQWDPVDYPMEKPGMPSEQFARDARSRASTHTVTSMASTVLTRASNVIQIAYIPGVTNRQSTSNAATPNTLVPPVPIPTSSLLSSRDDNILFMPGDLRDSTFTDLSELDLPTRKSIAPSLARSSIASAIVKDEAVQAVNLKVKPSMVSIGSKSPTTPPVPSIGNLDRFNSQNGKGPKILIPASIENSGPTGKLKPKTVTITKKGSASKLSLAATSSTISTPILESAAESTPLSQESRIISIAESHTTVESDHARAKRSTMGEDDESEIGVEGSPHSRARKSIVTRDRSPFTDDAAIVDSPTIKEPKTTKEEGPFGDDKAI